MTTSYDAHPDASTTTIDMTHRARNERFMRASERGVRSRTPCLRRRVPDQGALRYHPPHEENELAPVRRDDAHARSSGKQRARGPGPDARARRAGSIGQRRQGASLPGRGVPAWLHARAERAGPRRARALPRLQPPDRHVVAPWRVRRRAEAGVGHGPALRGRDDGGRARVLAGGSSGSLRAAAAIHAGAAGVRAAGRAAHDLPRRRRPRGQPGQGRALHGRRAASRHPAHAAGVDARHARAREWLQPSCASSRVTGRSTTSRSRAGAMEQLCEDAVQQVMRMWDGGSSPPPQAYQPQPPTSGGYPPPPASSPPPRQQGYALGPIPPSKELAPNVKALADSAVRSWQAANFRRCAEGLQGSARRQQRPAVPLRRGRLRAAAQPDARRARTHAAVPRQGADQRLSTLRRTALWRAPGPRAATATS